MRSVLSARVGWDTVGRVALALVTAVAVLTTGLGWWTVRGALHGITVSDALGADAPKSTGGSMNILLIGLDSRKDQQGNDLPQALLDKLHAGDSDNGGYNTNTLILAHITADNHVVAFSIPRDDYVRVTGIPGYDHIKIKEAYGLTKANAEQKLMDKGVTDQAELERKSREAGRAATLAAVRNLTGAPIDYFAEVNLAGFYDIAESLGGIEICLNHAVSDNYSGADFPAGRQMLDASQAVAFVRQRHGLDNGDLDRTHRQQAFLISVMHQLQKDGSFSDLGKLNQLIGVAQKDVVLSAGWGQSQFQRMGEIAGGANVQYRTLPVVRYDNIDGQDVNIVDPVAIKAEVAKAFGLKPPVESSTTANAAPSTSTETSTLDKASDSTGTSSKAFGTAGTKTAPIDVINASDVSGLGRQISDILSDLNYTIGQTRSSQDGQLGSTAVDFGVGAGAEAKHLAELLGIDAVRADPTVPAGHIHVTLGPGYQVPDTLDSVSMAAAKSSNYDSTLPTPESGPPVRANDGLPCVN
ncbi:LytR family transcriptional regulator [Mycobacterium sp. CBMA293]|uniref:LCP family protein n=3 Tax=Mycolicibacterium TaxID=1866885 RepID=UPI001323D73D|nr:LytR family transcriptional regulator [Mycolicibacterium sp. CBMA 360]MUL60442.1 LytR family transcriptional regulator [Mycolicibacterium sp. CBMA 335]MUL72257.1 LytR family transcriptional regulator [Mycolicibacterium sp. CBMA 311]MUL95342.1 LytR family transcriptional regulator [Mycolicibacterium sp. CBMA 230]MUM06837.1 transcriptional regulator, LytR family protein [Mycolicibacterium sp. CBMA 213]MUM13983.1 LytR family transcriptional regulator [Mycolicibacterium sp. CBMA 293]